MSGINLMLVGAAGAAEATDPNFEYVTLLLPGNGTNGAQNNTFLDSSTNAFSITRNGNTTQGTFSPFSQTGWSNYFDGTGDYLTVADNTALEFGSGDFTIEAWIYVFTTGPETQICQKGRTAVDSNGEYAFRQDGSSLYFYYSTNGTSFTALTSSASLVVNSWNHVAIVRSGNTYYFWINGVQSGTGTLNVTLYSGSGNLGIAANPVGSDPFTGYISNLRIVKGTAVYTSAFTPPTSALTAITGTSLLTCQSNRFVDNSTNNFSITVNGNTSVQAFSPFAPTAAYSAATNGGSGYFDGTGDYLSIANNAAIQIGSSDMTLECWVYSAGSQGGDDSIYRKSNGYTEYTLFWQSATQIRFVATTDGASWTVDMTANSIPSNSWVHVAVTRSGSNWTIWINGVSAATDTQSGTVTTNTSAATVGGSATAGLDFEGFISGLRLVKGTAVYTAPFTPPTTPPTAIANTSLLLNFTNAGITDATAKNDLETVGNAQISTAQSKFGGSSMYFDGTNDKLEMRHNPLQQFGTGDFTIEFWFYMSTFSGTSYVLVDKFDNNDGWQFYTFSDNKLHFYLNNADLLVSTTNLSATTWYYVAVTRAGTTARLFLNGTQEASATNSTDISPTTNLRIGESVGGVADLNGYMQDVRITKGIARYIANFTAPTAAFPLY